ncbi:MAG: O-antigen ligase family protein [Hyphomicrobiales bacterium]
MSPSPTIFGFDRKQLELNSDCAAVAVAISLPWSTSATVILVGLWLYALLVTLYFPGIRRELATAAGGLPALLFALGALGMLWADVTWSERLRGLDSFFKILMIPLLLYQFRRSGRGHWVLGAYLISCTLLLALSFTMVFSPQIAALRFLITHDFAVPTKNAATQSGEFITCAFVLAFIAIEMFRAGRRKTAVCALALALGFLANVFYIAASRTGLIVIAMLLPLLACKRFTVKGALVLLAAGAVLFAGAWTSSRYLQDRTTAVLEEIQIYRSENIRTSSGERIEFAKKSMDFIKQAPVIGNGTGSIGELFRRAAAGESGAAALATANPHNQTFAVGIQLGIIGIAVLWAMWIAHLLLFRGVSLPAWVGLVVVVQNIVGSVFNSHLFDFTQGWVYVFGVGVAGGMILRAHDTKPAPSQ